MELIWDILFTLIGWVALGLAWRLIWKYKKERKERFTPYVSALLAHYYSDPCLHYEHALCDVACGFCGKQCLCKCHTKTE